MFHFTSIVEFDFKNPFKINNNRIIKEFEVLNKKIKLSSLLFLLTKQKSNTHTACHYKRNSTD
ncbi:MAG TPA: hypothetical protein DER09_10880 [Prolixibacteraceae bacterium]|nr:hypothetical protein [Prolixibacteraceae bacterium]